MPFKGNWDSDSSSSSWLASSSGWDAAPKLQRFQRLRTQTVRAESTFPNKSLAPLKDDLSRVLTMDTGSWLAGKRPEREGCFLYLGELHSET